jgi:hypothetical protein
MGGGGYASVALIDDIGEEGKGRTKGGGAKVIEARKGAGGGKI